MCKILFDSLIEARRHAAVLVLKELMQNAPTLLYAFVPQVIDLIWVALRDVKVQIREAAGEALNACLDIIFQRESSFRIQWYNKVLEETHKGFKLGTPESIHGSLLTVGELFTKTGRVQFIRQI